MEKGIAATGKFRKQLVSRDIEDKQYWMKKDMCEEHDSFGKGEHGKDWLGPVL